MQLGYMRVSKADGRQKTDLQLDALIEDGVDPEHIYEGLASGRKDDRPDLIACLKALRPNDTLVVWKLDRLGRSLKHLVEIIEDLNERKIGFKVLTGKGASIDTTTATGRLIFGIFAALAEYEHELISERTRAGLASARARGIKGGRRPKMTKPKMHLAQSALKDPKTNVAALCRELGITRQTLYRHLTPQGELREDGRKALAR